MTTQEKEEQAKKEDCTIEDILTDSAIGQNIPEPEEGDSDYSERFTHESDGNITDDNLWLPHIKGIFS